MENKIEDILEEYVGDKDQHVETSKVGDWFDGTKPHRLLGILTDREHNVMVVSPVYTSGMQRYTVLVVEINTKTVIAVCGALNGQKHDMDTNPLDVTLFIEKVYYGTSDKDVLEILQKCHLGCIIDEE